MFTLEAIKAAHAKVKSGADFPKYIQELKTELTIAQQTNAEQFKHQLKVHQQGGTDYPTFCKDCADAGIEKWIVDLPTMTCTYYDTTGRNILVENIPQPQ